jgi:hypothetical protein
MDNNYLGKKAKDKVTGFEGIITSEHNYLTGCTQYGLQGTVGSDGKIPKIEYLDKVRLEIIGEGIDPILVNNLDDPGCDFREHPEV